ncbi:6-phosphogluconolactonase [Paenibacillus phyllosphaerae]|uniref:6-phosphogluconolactonase n=1 Tax=Paenibacillus phyllosphaerae TaxID=274593 RepID=A0A7W5B493_9BACL|nr:lactonase family protein [Paenibacillus phyllosphaerae]MBB3114110.1 6-phosphogluconolactonase [Paenibacillus phyllosphaerae]
MQQLFYVGSYAEKDQEGIYLYSLDLQTGALTRKEAIAGTENPSFLTLSKDGTRLYAVGETTDHRPGSVASFIIGLQGEGLTPLNEQSTLGNSPCHVVLSRDEKAAIVVNYGGGNVISYPVMADGSIGPTAINLRHEGRGVRDDRQEGPHPHSAIIDPSGNYVLVADLGIDKLIHYRLDGAEGMLEKVGETDTPPGTGPRHMAFYPDGRRLYVVGELDNNVHVYRYEPGQAQLTLEQTISTLPEGYDGVSWSADIHISGDGRFLYTSNRGHDSIAVFAVDEQGLLTAAGHVSTGGQTPRNFGLTPDGRFLLAANQQSNSIVSFYVDTETGMLTETGHRAEIGAPVCIRFA